MRSIPVQDALNEIGKALLALMLALIIEFGIDLSDWCAVISAAWF